MRFGHVVPSFVLMSLLAGCGGPAGNQAESHAQPPATPPMATPLAQPAPAREMAKIEPERPKKVTVTLPAGTQLKVRTNSVISTKTAEAGETFSGTLIDALTTDGRTLAPQGAEVTGRIVDADRGGKVKGVASISVQLTRLDTAAGPVGISTNVIAREARASKKKDAVKVGIGAGVGSAIGAIAGGGKGAAIGAAAGAGAGTGAVLATRGVPAVIPSESVVTFRLTAPLSVTVSPEADVTRF